MKSVVHRLFRPAVLREIFVFVFFATSSIYAQTETEIAEEIIHSYLYKGNTRNREASSIRDLWNYVNEAKGLNLATDSLSQGNMRLKELLLQIWNVYELLGHPDLVHKKKQMLAYAPIEVHESDNPTGEQRRYETFIKHEYARFLSYSITIELEYMHKNLINCRERIACVEFISLQESAPSLLKTLIYIDFVSAAKELPLLSKKPFLGYRGFDPPVYEKILANVKTKAARFSQSSREFLLSEKIQVFWIISLYFGVSAPLALYFHDSAPDYYTQELAGAIGLGVLSFVAALGVASINAAWNSILSDLPGLSELPELGSEKSNLEVINQNMIEEKALQNRYLPGLKIFLKNDLALSSMESSISYAIQAQDLGKSTLLLHHIAPKGSKKLFGALFSLMDVGGDFHPTLNFLIDDKLINFFNNEGVRYLFLSKYKFDLNTKFFDIVERVHPDISNDEYRELLKSYQTFLRTLPPKTKMLEAIASEHNEALERISLIRKPTCSSRFLPF